MSGETELKPCPICQKHDTAICVDGFTLAHLDENQFAVCCDVNRGGCGCMSGFRGTREDAILAWNRRATPPGYETVPEGASDYKALYHELVYQVGIKHPDETRHQTALRYLTNAENQQNNTPQQAKEPPNAQGL